MRVRRRSKLRPSAPGSVLLLAIRARLYPKFTDFAGEHRTLTCNRREVNPGTGFRRSWGRPLSGPMGHAGGDDNDASAGTLGMLVETLGGSRSLLTKGHPCEVSPRRRRCLQSGPGTRRLPPRGNPPPLRSVSTGPRRLSPRRDSIPLRLYCPQEPLSPCAAYRYAIEDTSAWLVHQEEADPHEGGHRAQSSTISTDSRVPALSRGIGSPGSGLGFLHPCRGPALHRRFLRRGRSHPRPCVCVLRLLLRVRQSALLGLRDVFQLRRLLTAHALRGELLRRLLVCVRPLRRDSVLPSRLRVGLRVLGTTVEPQAVAAHSLRLCRRSVL